MLRLDEGAVVEHQVLAQAEALHLRWVISAESCAYEVLQRRRFGLRSAWKGDLTLWERSSVTPLKAPGMPENASSWLWALMPQSSLAAGLVLGPWRRTT